MTYDRYKYPQRGDFEIENLKGQKIGLKYIDDIEKHVHGDDPEYWENKRIEIKKLMDKNRAARSMVIKAFAEVDELAGVHA